MHFKNVWRAFVSAFKFDLRFVFVLVYEWLFVLIATGLVWLFVDVVYRFSLSAKDLPNAAFTPANVDLLKQFYVNSVLAFVVLFVLVTFVYVVIQGLEWGQALRKPLTPRFVWKFFLANLAWLVPWFALIWFCTVAFQPAYLAWGIVLLSVLFTHLTFLYQHELVLKGAGIKQAVRYAFSTGILAAHKFILPYVLAIIVFFAWSQLWRLVHLQTPSIFTGIVLVGLIFAPFLAWLKFFMDRIIVILGL